MQNQSQDFDSPSERFIYFEQNQQKVNRYTICFHHDQDLRILIASFCSLAAIKQKHHHEVFICTHDSNFLSDTKFVS